jgi:hypothetical protein
VPRAFLDEAISSIREYVEKMMTKLVFNFDEVGMSEWDE